MMDNTSKTVGFVLYDGCTLLDFAGATQVFAPWASHWDPIWLAPTLDPIMTSEGLAVVPKATFDDHPPLDVVFVPGGAGQGVSDSMGDPRYSDWLCRMAQNPDRWVGAVCVGTFILAAAGILKGLEVTTHWMLLDELRKISGTLGFTVPDGFPRSVIDREARRFTGGGVSSSIDLGLALVEDLSGADRANSACLIIQYDPVLPKGVMPGSPDKMAPAIVAQMEANPVIQSEFVGKITAAADKLV